MKETRATPTGPYMVEYTSLSEYVDAATFECDHFTWAGKTWLGASSLEEAKRHALFGNGSDISEAVTLSKRIAERILETEKVRVTVNSVRGKRLNTSRFVQDRPDCLRETRKQTASAPAVTVVVPGFFSACVDEKTVRQFGASVMAFLLTMQRLNRPVELVLDVNAARTVNGKSVYSARVTLAKAGQKFDPAVIMNALSNPSMLRMIGFSTWHNAPKDVQKWLGVGSTYGLPTDVDTATYPENTFILPAIKYHNDADKTVKEWLIKAGVNIPE